MKRLHLTPVLVLLALPPTALHGQERSAREVPPGFVGGRVLDAGTGAPVADALVVLGPVPAGLVAGAGGGMVGARSQVTGPLGAYAFGGLAPGRYGIRVERIGYRPATLEVELGGPPQVRVSVGLELDPIALDPLEVEGRPAATFQRAANRPAELEGARLSAERERRSLFLTPDSRSLTMADVADGVTLGEGDVFRALQRLPGVGTRDDYTAELWTRGAPWTQTRVTFDGVPLFNPVHAVGVLSAIAPEVLGAVFFHPGARPASMTEGAAGAVDLRSRPAAGEGGLGGVADLSLASAKLALEQRIPGRGGWVVAGRRSHVDVLSGGLSSFGLDTLDLPYRFHDLAGRADLELGGGVRLEASGLWEEDRLEGDLDDVLERTTGRWGNRAGRVSLSARLGGLELAHTLGGSRFSATAHERRVRTRKPVQAWTEPASSNRIRHASLAGELSPASDGGPASWSAGYDLVRQSVDYQGPRPRYYAVPPDTSGTIPYQRDLTILGAWGEVRFDLGERLALSPGIRVETGDRVAGASTVRLSPRLAARYRFSPDHSLAVGLGRSWQTAQAIALAGPSFHPAFHASHFWVWADGRTPAIRAAVASLGSEHWLGGGWLASGTVFLRRAQGVVLPSPRPGRLAPRERPLWVAGENDARGLELALRRVGARWSASLGYSWTVSEVDAEGLRFPAPADRRHVWDAMAATRLPGGLRAALAWTSMSGAPFTRAVVPSEEDCTFFGFGCGVQDALLEAPNGERTPAYASLDASLHWTRALGGLDLEAYLQVKNVLGRENASTYAGTVRWARPTRAGRELVVEDRFEPGLPRLPLFGLRVAF